MGNIYVNLPVPSANGSGAAVDISGKGALKTIILSGDANARVNIEINNDVVPNGSWSAVATFANPGAQTIMAAARWMRATVVGYKGGTPQVDIGSTDGGSLFAALPVTPSTGAGAAVDVSALGNFKTVTVGDDFRGNVLIEASEDGVDHWATAFSFLNAGNQSMLIAAKWMRVRRVGVPTIAPGLPIVNVGGSNDTGGGGGGVVTDSFIFVATGAEGDTFPVPLPLVRADVNYVAHVTGAGFAGGFLILDAPVAGYALDHIQVKTSAPVVAGDRIAVTVTNQVP